MHGATSLLAVEENPTLLCFEEGGESKKRALRLIRAGLAATDQMLFLEARCTDSGIWIAATMSR